MVFVTGGTGVLGAHLLVELCKAGKSIRAIKRPSSDLQMVKDIFNFYLYGDAEALFNQIDWVEGDILDIPILEELMTGTDIVYHCAGNVSFDKKDFQKLIKTNKLGTANMVNVALSTGVKQFCHVSSTAAIGRQKKSEVYTEKQQWVTSSENSNYAVSKYSAEMEVWRGVEEGLNATIVNPCVILGAGYWTESSLSIFDSVQNGLKFYPSGQNAFVDARDVARIMVQLIDQKIMKERFLVTSENLQFKVLFDLIADALNVKPPQISAKKWMVELGWRLERLLALITFRRPKITKETARNAMSESKYDHSKIVTALNYQFIPIKDAVKNAVAFHLQYNRKKN
ncbi:MAG: NAD-dependent epimerase/dehydratase family protein [Putridiphycobacter sp.]|nr:NAD-dependent epimerase/dehydratase family protein [Putridiphycobacter sp.]